MQQEKMGCLLRELRKEKNLTQEQMAELLGVSNRTVSRWENGINMPDISLLVDISNYFEISILELIEGERKQDTMVTEKNEELEKIANYADEQKHIALRNVRRRDVIGLVGCVLSAVFLDGYKIFGYDICLLFVIMFIGIIGGILIWNIMYASGISDILNHFEKKYLLLKYFIILVLVILLLTIGKDIYLILTGRFW